MEPVRLEFVFRTAKSNWNEEEVESVKGLIDTYFVEDADWNNAANELGLLYEKDYESFDLGEGVTCSALRVTNGDFYVEQGVRMLSFLLTQTGEVVLVGSDDDLGKRIAYFLK